MVDPDVRRRFAELDRRIRELLRKGRELATPAYACPVCDEAGCERCDGTGIVSLDRARELAARLGSGPASCPRLVGQEIQRRKIEADPADWQDARDLARLTTLTVAQIRSGSARGYTTDGWKLERRAVTPIDRQRLALHGSAKYLYRALEVT